MRKADPNHVAAQMQRARIAPEVIDLYRQGFGHKTIAKRLSFSIKATRKILIEHGEWKPGSLKHRCGISSAVLIARKRAEFRKALSKNRKAIRSTRTKWRAAVFRIRRRRPSTPSIRKAIAEYHRQRYHFNTQYRLRVVLRRRIRKVIEKGIKRGSSLQLLGCDMLTFKAHLESLFLPGMQWANYGQWHLDHIQPCASFDLRIESQQRACFHYTNYRPLWAEDNYRKGSLWNGKRHYLRNEKASRV